jgi:hypothetical protein
VLTKEALMSTRAGIVAAIELAEDRDHTEARATLELNGQSFTGTGRAQRNPADPNVPVIGEELAIARALSDLAQELAGAAAETITDVARHPAGH